MCVCLLALYIYIYIYTHIYIYIYIYIHTGDPDQRISKLLWDFMGLLTLPLSSGNLGCKDTIDLTPGVDREWEAP